MNAIKEKQQTNQEVPTFLHRLNGIYYISTTLFGFENIMLMRCKTYMLLNSVTTPLTHEFMNENSRDKHISLDYLLLLNIAFDSI